MELAAFARYQAFKRATKRYPHARHFTVVTGPDGELVGLPLRRTRTTTFEDQRVAAAHLEMDFRLAEIATHF